MSDKMRTKDTEMSKTMIESKMMIEKRKCGERERERATNDTCCDCELS